MGIRRLNYGAVTGIAEFEQGGHCRRHAKTARQSEIAALPASNADGRASDSSAKLRNLTGGAVSMIQINCAA